MKDRYLFRGKDTDTGKWITGGYCEIPPPPQVCGDLPPATPCIVCEDPHYIPDWGMQRKMGMVEVNPATICQCTGLKDKDGNLIYEGDIVKVGNQTHEIRWHKNGWCKWGYTVWPLGDSADAEIIGNMIDNPELLPEAANG